MAEPLDGTPATHREDARAVALAEELGTQLGRLKGGGPKIKQLLSMVQLDRPSDRDAGADWGAISAEHHSGKPASTALGRAQDAFLQRHTRR